MKQKQKIGIFTICICFTYTIVVVLLNFYIIQLAVLRFVGALLEKKWMKTETSYNRQQIEQKDKQIHNFGFYFKSSINWVEWTLNVIFSK